MYDNVPYRYHVVEDFSDEYSVLITVLHHSYYDGVAYMSLLIAMSDDKDFAIMPNVSPPSKIEQLLAELASPLPMLKLARTFLTMRHEDNCFRKEVDRTPMDR